MITILTLDLAHVARLWAVFAEMTHLLTIPTGDRRWVTRLVTFFADMSFLATISAVVPSTGRAILREVAHCKLLGREQEAIA